MPSPSHLLLNFPELRPHAVASGFPFDQELSPTARSTDEGKAEKVEGFRFSQPALSASVRRKAAELDQAGLLRMEWQRELPQSIAHGVPEAPGISLVLTPDDQVIGVSHDNHGAHGLTMSPPLGPEIKHVVQVNVGKER